ncbi:MAG: hypothetical protein JXQ75_12395 [Phycisphaerae bacterium]|nr:hypothetical protein [Phycisphaerae bacterium]
MQTTLKVLVAVVAMAVAWQVGQVARVSDGASVERELPPRPVRPVSVGGQFRGMAVQLHGGVGVYDRYNRLIPEIAGLGADTVLFVVHGWQDHAGSLDLHIDAQKTADPEEVGRLCQLAKAHGLRTILMPIVLLSNPRGSEWRGKIIPANREWDAWFRRYAQFIVRFAKIAERHRVEVLMVGSELIKTEQYTDRWRRTIEEVRQHYRGKLGYSANWDHYQTSKIGFWASLDCVGMTTYYELAEGPNPSIEEIDATWAKIKTEITAFQQEVRKPIIFTEVGWCSQEGAAHEGWNYYAKQEATAAGHQEQAILYESFIKAWSDEPGVGGIIWWEWDLSSGGVDDYGYTPRGKPAEKVLRRWFAGEARVQGEGLAARGKTVAPDCGTGVSPVVFTVRNGVSEPLFSLSPRADGHRAGITWAMVPPG